MKDIKLLGYIMNFISWIKLKKKEIKKKDSNRKVKNKDIILKTIILLVIILLSVDFFLFFWSKGDKIEPYEWGSRLDISYKINECYELFFDPENEDKIKILIIGDSRPECAFYPKLFDDYSNEDTISYNLAIPATAIKVQSFLIQKIIIPKLEPDIVIWDVSLPEDFSDDEEINDEEERTLNTPMGRYYSNNIEGLDFEEKCQFYLFKHSRIYRYRSNLRPRLFYLNEYEKSKIAFYEDWYERGFFKHYNTLSDYNKEFTEIRPIFKINEDFIDDFFETIEILEDNIDHFLIVNGPNLNQTFIYPELYAFLNKLSPKNFLDLNGNEIFNFVDLWLNPTHLNIMGATLYTKMVYEKLSYYI